jgi:hypothetical protein
MPSVAVSKWVVEIVLMARRHSAGDMAKRSDAMICKNVISPPGSRKWSTKSTRNFMLDVLVIGINIFLYTI